MFYLAIRFLLYDKTKTLGALFGVIISIFLIGQNTGIFTFLTNAMKSIPANVQTDIWVVDDRTTNATALSSLDVRVLREVGSVPGVGHASPFISTGAVGKFADGTTAGLNLIGTEAPQMQGVWNLVKGTKNDLLPESAVSIDVFDASQTGGSKLGDWFEINGQKAYIATQTRGARGFGAIYCLTTVERARAYANFPTNKVSAVLVTVAPGQAPAQVRDLINQSIPGVKAWLREDFAQATMTTILFRTGIAISTGTLVVFAIISGSVIIGLTLYSAAIDRLRDYGIMKAVGASNGYVSRIIYLQALLLGVVGYGIATVLLEFFRNGIAKAGTLFDYSPEVRLVFLAVTLFIALGGAFVAARRIRKLEPAAIFRM
jgi:putative ABC transport system permease protein